MPGTNITGYQYDKTLVSYVTKKKKVVLLLSTMHDSIELDENTQKPIKLLIIIPRKEVSIQWI